MLVALDLTKKAVGVVHYVGRMMSNNKDVRITLMHIVSEPSPDIMPEKIKRGSHVEKQKKDAAELMHEAVNILVSYGVPEENILPRIKLCSKNRGIAEQILYEKRNGSYETIVVGRRGVTKKEEFLFGSVSSKIIHETKNCSVWVVT